MLGLRFVSPGLAVAIEFYRKEKDSLQKKKKKEGLIFAIYSVRVHVCELTLRLKCTHATMLVWRAGRTICGNWFVPFTMWGCRI